MKPGKVYLVGGGPGDPGLLTVKGRQLIEIADVIVYDYLSNPQLLLWNKTGAEKIYVGKAAGKHTLTQEEINQLLVEKSREGKTVVRLKGGDPYIFGRGAEEAQILMEAKVPFEVVPGITSAIAAPCYAGIPVTHRNFNSSVTFITGHEDPTKEETALDWKLLAQDRGTKVFLMGMERLKLIAEKLVDNGAKTATPVALVRWGTMGRQESLIGTLKDIAEKAAEQKFGSPAVIVVGSVVNLREKLNWFETKPLFGKKIVVTRTRIQASALSDRLREQGAHVLEIPTIKIVPQALPKSVQDQFKNLSAHYDWIVFTSPNGVDNFFHEFFAQQDDIRALGHIKIGAVGPATAQKLKEAHLKVDKQPTSFTSEALAESFASEEIAQQRFCLPCGDLANPYLRDHLRKNSGQVTEWIVYKTVPEYDDFTGAHAEYEKSGADWITFTSSSTVENWHKLGLKLAEHALQPLYASIGPVTSETMKKLGYKIDFEAEEHTIPGLVDALLKRMTKK